MECPHCGAAVPPGSTFCTSCRKRVAAPSAGFGGAPAPTPPVPRTFAPQGHAAPATWSPPSGAGVRGDITSGPGGERFRRPGVVTLLAVLDLIGGVLCLLVGLGLAGVGIFAGSSEALVMVAVGAFYLLIGAVQVAAGVGMLKLKAFGRALQIGLSIVGLLGIPLGTIISIVVLVYLFKPGVKLLFSGRTPQDLAPHEQEEVARAMGSTAVVVIVAVLVLLVVVATVGIIAAIAIPSLLRARVSANESSAMGDLRTVISAQAAYAASNGGFHDRLACMVESGTCIPGYPPGAPPFLHPTMAQATRRGYVFTFHEGPRPTPGTFDPSQVSPTSMTSFAYTAVPAQPNQTGVRGFCGDASGLLCSTDGSEPRPVAGACPADCTPVR